MRRWRLVAVKHRMVFGTIEAAHHVLRPLGWQSNPSFIARLHRSLRQHVAAMGRQTSTRCKGEDGLCPRLAG